MKRIRPMILKAEYYPPSETRGFEETPEDIRTALTADRKRDLVRFSLINILGVSLLLWFAFYLLSNSKEHEPSLLLVLLVLATVTYLFFGFPLIVYSKVQRQKNLCRICGSKVIFEDVGSGRISQTNVICTNCRKFSVSTKFSIVVGSE